jgi:epoxide hydrolase-like predicted phosphatase
MRTSFFTFLTAITLISIIPSWSYGAPKKFTAIIVDLTDVLFTENKSGFTKQLGLKSLASYTLTHWKNPVESCLDILEKMSNEESVKGEYTITYKGRTMPRCMCEWQQGKKTYQDVQQELADFMKQAVAKGYFTSNNEYAIIETILSLSLDPQQVPFITKPITPMVELMEKLKKAGYTLYILANFTMESFATLSLAYPDVITLFDDIVLSAHAQALKPSPKIFTHLLEKHNLNPDQCIFIDDQEEYVQTAEQLGITGILYTKPQSIQKKLRALGIL